MPNYIDKLQRKIRQMIKQAVISIITDDSGPYPTGQAIYNGKVTEFLRYSPYGLESNPPEGSWVLLLESQGQESTKIGLPADFLNRKKGKKSGEVRLHNTLSGSNVLLKENGDIEIDSQKDVTIITVGDLNATVSGKVNLNVVGNVDIVATGNVNLGGLGGAGVARIGDAVAGGVITGGSTKVFSA